METNKNNMNDLFTFAEFDEMESEHIAAPRYSYWKSVFRTFFRNKFTVAVAILLLFILCFALIQPMRSGYSPIVTPNINNPALQGAHLRNGPRGQRGVRRGVGRRPELHHHLLRLYGHQHDHRHPGGRRVGLLQEDG